MSLAERTSSRRQTIAVPSPRAAAPVNASLSRTGAPLSPTPPAPPLTGVSARVRLALEIRAPGRAASRARTSGLATIERRLAEIRRHDRTASGYRSSDDPPAEIAGATDDEEGPHAPVEW